MDRDREGTVEAGLFSGESPWLHSLSHIGQVVPDLNATMARYRNTYGLRWAPVQHRHFRWRDRSGDEHDVDLRYTMSVQGPVHLEIIEHAPGSVWSTDGNALHHLCYWVDDLDAEAARLRASGFQFEATRAGPDEFNGVAYFLSPEGLRVEPKPEAGRAPLEQWLAGDDYNWPPVPLVHT